MHSKLSCVSNLAFDHIKELCTTAGKMEPEQFLTHEAK